MIDHHRTKSCQIWLKSLKRKGFGGFFIPEIKTRRSGNELLQFLSPAVKRNLYN